MAPLKVIYDSLVSTGFELVADGHVSDVIRRVAVFGLTLVPLDIREESTKHTLALDAITRHLGIGSYKVSTSKCCINCWTKYCFACGTELNVMNSFYRNGTKLRG